MEGKKANRSRLATRRSDMNRETTRHTFIAPVQPGQSGGRVPPKALNATKYLPYTVVIQPHPAKPARPAVARSTKAGQTKTHGLTTKAHPAQPKPFKVIQAKSKLFKPNQSQSCYFLDPINCSSNIKFAPTGGFIPYASQTSPILRQRRLADAAAN
jgi:hypothetical protein